MTPVEQSPGLVHQLSSSDEKIAFFRSLFRGRQDVYPASIREPENREVRLRTRMRQRVGTRHLRKAARQMRGVPKPPLPAGHR